VHKITTLFQITMDKDCLLSLHLLCSPKREAYSRRFVRASKAPCRANNFNATDGIYMKLDLQIVGSERKDVNES